MCGSYRFYMPTNREPNEMVYIGQCILLMGIILGIWRLLRPTIRVKNKKEIGVKRASSIYSDEKGTKMLIAQELGLQGKPDMIFETWVLRSYIPLEIKSGTLKEEMPHEGDLYQLVIYFILIEAVYGKRPPYGKLVYANKTFKVRNTAKLRKMALKTVEEMRAMLNKKYRPQATPEYMKCKHCVCRETVCEWIEGD